jgi:hypothetical protein
MPLIPIHACALPHVYPSGKQAAFHNMDAQFETRFRPYYSEGILFNMPTAAVGMAPNRPNCLGVGVQTLSMRNVHYPFASFRSTVCRMPPFR